MVATAAGVVVLAGCSTGGAIDTSAPPTSRDVSAPSTSRTTSTMPYAGAPKVSNPLPASVLDGDPCANALTPEQVKQAIGVQVAGKPNTLVAEALGPSCAWANITSLGQIIVTYVTQPRTGLSGVYKNTKPKNPVWREISDLHGFPAVAFSDNTDHDCTVTIGIADDLSVDVGGILGDTKRGKADSCEVVAQMAGLVVDTVKKRAGA